mgnify:CR=1 FL=1
MKHQVLALLAAASLSLTGCAVFQKPDENHVIDIGSIGIPETTEPPTEPAFQKAKVSVAAVGDNMIHTCVYKTAKEHAAEGTVYDFHYCYKDVENRIAEADIAFINQETLICDGKLELAGTSKGFNSPVELGYDLISSGFDVFNMANSHVLDEGAEGLEYTLDYWDTIREKYENVTVLGAYRGETDMQNFRIIEKDDLKIGFLGYTSHTRGISLPEDSAFIVPYADNEELMQRQIRELESQTDCVIVSMHWGEEDSSEVEDSERELAQKLINWGADVIIGTGSHTLRSMEYLSRPDGSRGFVFYSLGNFISGQTDNFNLVGGMGEFNICRDNDGNITIEDIGVTPVLTHYDTDMRNVRNYFYDEYTDDLLEEHDLPHTSGGYAKKWNWTAIDEIIEENIPEEFRRNYTANSTVDETEIDEDDD